MQQLIMQNILRWPATSHRAIYQAKNPAHHFVAEEDLCEAVGGSMQCRHQEPVMRLQYKDHHSSQPNSSIMHHSSNGNPISVKGAKGMDIGLINAHRTDRVIVVAEDTLPVGDLDVEDVVDSKCSVDVEEETLINQSMPPWSRPDQELLHRRHRCRKLPQCPCLQGRETNCAPSWPVQSAGGEVGAP